MIQMINVQELLGKSQEDAAMQDFFRPLKASLSIEKFDDRQDFGIKKEGVCFMFEDNILTSIQFYDVSSEPEYEGFKGCLPYGLQFSDSKETVEARMGKPERSLDHAVPDPILGEILPWVRYEMEDCKLTLRFTKSLKRINLVSIKIGRRGQIPS